MTALGLLCGCAVGPDFKKPQTGKIPEEWSPGERAAPAANLTKWWENFGDETLNSLMERALAQNLSIAAARERINQARANLGITSSGLYPALDVEGRYGQSSTFAGPSSAIYNLGTSAAWEVDVFGGVRREVESKEADYAAAMADKAAVQVSITGQLAQVYFDYRGLQQEILITKNNLATQRQTLSVTQKKKQSGFSSEYDVVRAQSQTYSTDAQIPALERELAQAQHTMEFLLGLKTGALAQELKASKDMPLLEDYTPRIGVPANLLERRPDIMVAEYKIKAASAKIGAATADYFPKFYITGSIYYQAPSAGDVFTRGSGNWSVGPSMEWNIFNAGKTYFSVELQKSITKEAGISWEETVLTAVKEVEDALVAIAKQRERVMLLKQAAESNKTAFAFSKRLYDQGEIEFLDMLDSQRSMLTAEQSEVTGRRQLAGYIADLYAALGGGWDYEDPAQNPQLAEKSAKAAAAQEAEKSKETARENAKPPAKQNS